jgi:RNA polymerase sigma-70 factor (ECF subfamily)
VADTVVSRDAGFDFEAAFRRDYARIARLVARVIGDRDRAEDLTVEAFWRLWRTPRAQGEAHGGWVYRTALRLALDELRRRTRRARYEALFPFSRAPQPPDELVSAAQDQSRVRAVLAALSSRDASLLVLQSEGCTYDEMGHALSLNPASVGTLLARAKEAFRTVYVRRYGER